MANTNNTNIKNYVFGKKLRSVKISTLPNIDFTKCKIKHLICINNNSTKLHHLPLITLNVNKKYDLNGMDNINDKIKLIE